MTATPEILVIEDDPSLRRFLSMVLTANEYRVADVETLRDGLCQVASRSPAAILLDLGLPDGDGVDLAQQIRQWSGVPIIVLSARDQIAEKVRALDAGADDYLTKPFSVDELLVRLRVALRHGQGRQDGEKAPIFVAGALRIDLIHRRVFRDGREVHLTPTEYRLLGALVQNAGKVVTHRHLMTAVWGPEYGETVHYLRVYMAQLRQKLEPDSARPQFLLTEPGIGYRLKNW